MQIIRANPKPCSERGAPVSTVDSADRAIQSSDIQTIVDRQAELVGARIRALRRLRGLTLVQLAGLADLSHPFLSQLERGRARPSLVSLEKIARALGSSQLELVADADADQALPAAMVVRADEGTTGTYGGGEARMLVHGDRPFHPMAFLGSNTESGEYFAHAEDEFIHVIAGRVEVDLGGEGVFDLGADDSIYFAGGTPHRWRSPTGRPYRLIVVKQKPDAPAHPALFAPERAPRRRGAPRPPSQKAP